MPIMETNMKLVFALSMFLGLLVAGCDGDAVDNGVVRGVVEEDRQFRLPSQLYRLESSHNPQARIRTQYSFNESSWKARGWSLWVAANVYSSAKYPQGLEDTFGWTDASSASDRAKHDGAFLAAVNEFIRTNELDLEVNYLGYDPIPVSVLRNSKVWDSGGRRFQWNASACEFAFNRCIDNYFVSPVDRYSGGERMSFKDWIDPYFRYRDGQYGLAAKTAFQRMNGGDGEKSHFYDWWPTMVFLVNPDGDVARAWLPQSGNTASIGSVVSAISSEMNIDKPVVVQANQAIGPTRHAYYGEYFLEAGVKRLNSTLSRLIEE